MVYYVILGLIIVVLVGVAVRLYLLREENKKEVEAVEKERDECVSFGEGITLYQDKMVAKKQEYKNKILDLIKEKGKVSNKDIRNSLGVSEASATRYAEELETENKIKQTGKTGRSVFYE